MSHLATTPNGCSETAPLIEATGLYKVYRRGHEQITAVCGVDLTVMAGTFLLITGPSGGGKSTLLHLLGGIDRPSQGTLCVNGMALETAGEQALTRFRREQVGFVFQFYNLLPALNALDNVALPLLARGLSWRKARAQAEINLDEVGLSRRRQHRPAELSGGEQQRVAIARALIGRPALLLADEPTGDLDSTAAEEVMELMAGLNRRLRTTFIVASHNRQLSRYASHLYEMGDGRLHGPL
jgi:putative ABC transport system ATP-binding protein